MQQLIYIPTVRYDTHPAPTYLTVLELKNKWVTYALTESSTIHCRSTEMKLQCRIVRKNAGNCPKCNEIFVIYP
jgi:hypothetical protein